jgi:U4/U6.U5 tri-snRNP-associated protein 1
MDAASIEEINKLRKSMGLKLLPVPGAAPEQQSSIAEPDEDAPSTLESREAQAYENYRKNIEAEEAKKKREERSAAIKKARDKAQRFAVLEGKGLADADDGAEVDTKTWLKNQKKRQKDISKARKLAEEQAAAEEATRSKIQYTADDLAGIKVGHEASTFLDGDDKILTLKDVGVLDEDDDQDVLENQDLRDREALQEKLDLKKKKPLYDPNDIDETGERSILAQYDDEISGKKKKLFTLNAQGATDELADILEAPAQKRRTHGVDIEVLGKDSVIACMYPLILTNAVSDDAPPSDYLDISEVKVKKPKKKKSKATRQRGLDEDGLLQADADSGQADGLMDVDSGTFTKKRKVVDESFVDDDDLQNSLSMQRRDALKKRKKMRPEDIAKQLREEASPDPDESGQAGGLVLDEITGFVDTLQKSSVIEERKPRATKAEQSVTAMDEDSSDEDRDMEDATAIKEESPAPQGELTTTGVDDEEVVGQGLGSTLKLLKDRGLVKDQGAGQLNDQFRRRELFLAELHRRMAVFDEETKQQRERDRASGRLDRMSARDREEWQRQQNTMRDQHQSRIMDQLFKEGYKPSVELKYVDDYGRRLDQKEAFKHLSHQFHGKGSGKGKTDKRLKKIEDEKRREAQSMLDASQSAGMSSAAAYQTKKRREPGVRLA